MTHNRTRNRVRRFYTPEQKAEALLQLRQNYGDIAHTSRQLSIPVRTLRAWRQEFRAYSTTLGSSAVSAVSATAEPDDLPPSEPHIPADAAEAADEFEKLRAHLMAQVIQLTAEDSIESVVTRAAAPSKLLTWVFKLDEVIPRMRPTEEVIRIEYLNPDGKISTRPYWAEREDGEELTFTGSSLWQHFYPDEHDKHEDS